MPPNDRRRSSTYLEVSRSFRANFDAPGKARRFLAETLDQAGAASLIDDAKLVVSELATNAVVHARSAFTVSLSMTDEDLCIWVSDDSCEPLALRETPPEEGRGRGLAIVAALASAWGTEQTAQGKSVFVRLRLNPGGAVDGSLPRSRLKHRS
jgi:anti-sigma regulatory factor (Ser/Thr protein kinase)